MMFTPLGSCRFSHVLTILALFVGFCLGSEVKSTDTLLDMSIEELMDMEVSSAGFFVMEKHKAPGYVMVYDMDRIEKTSVRTLDDLINLHVPGSITGNHERHRTLHGVRGVLIDNSAKTLVMLDGQQVNQRSHFGYPRYISPLMGHLQTVEVIHGPGAILHGSGAINGFVNLIPKTGTSHPGTYVNAEYGFAEESNLIEAGHGFLYGDNRDLYVYGGTVNAQGWNEDFQYGQAESGYGSNSTAIHGFFSPSFELNSKWRHDGFDLNLFGYSYEYAKQSITEAGYQMRRGAGVGPKYTFNLSDQETLDLVGSLLWMDHGDTYGQLNKRMYGGSERHTEIKTILKTTRWDKHRIAVGALYGRKNFRDRNFYLGNETPFDNYESINTTWTEMSVFAEDVIDILPNTTMSIGLRYDQTNTDEFSCTVGSTNYRFTPDQVDGHWSPRFALAWEMDDTSVLKGSYQHGFRMPDAAYYVWRLSKQSTAESLGIPTDKLTPEQMDSYEINYTKHFSDRFVFQGNAFYNLFEDQINWDLSTKVYTAAQWSAMTTANPSLFDGMFINVRDRFEVWGGELVGQWKIADNTDLDLSYSYANINRKATTQRYPNHIVKGNIVSHFFDDRLILALTGLFNTPFKNDATQTVHDVYLRDRYLVDFATTWRITNWIAIKGNIQNAFGSSVPGPTVNMTSPHAGNSGYHKNRMYLSAIIQH